jgi:hypothetical protein
VSPRDICGRVYLERKKKGWIFVSKVLIHCSLKVYISKYCHYDEIGLFLLAEVFNLLYHILESMVENQNIDLSHCLHCLLDNVLTSLMASQIG